MKHLKDILISILIILILIGIDQLTKYLAFKNLDEGITYKAIPHLFKFTLVRNDGAAFSMLEGKQWFFYIITILALGGFGFLMKDVDIINMPIFTVSLCLIISGTIGNFIDRVIYSSVRDFLTFDFMNFAIFNFADMCLTIGMILLVIDFIFGKTGKLWTKA